MFIRSGGSREIWLHLKQEVDVACNLSGWRRWLSGVAASISFGFAFFPSPALAETTTILCEAESAGKPGGNWLFNIDYSAGTISYQDWKTAAIITAQDIRFKLVSPPQKPSYGPPIPIVITLDGAISRVAGTGYWMYYRVDGGEQIQAIPYEARCRPATQKF